MRKIRSSLSLIRASFGVLRKDKKIMWSFVFQFLVSMALLSTTFAVLVATGAVNLSEFADGAEPTLEGIGLIVIISYIALATILSEFTAAYVITSALSVFRGEPKSHQQVMSVIGRRKWAILKFSFLTMTVGLVLRVLEDRVPLAGRIAVWLVGAAWAVAAMFAIPVITDGGEDDPVVAVKKSAMTLSKVFGDSIKVTLGVSAILFAVAMSGFILWGAAIVLAVSISSGVIAIVASVLMVLMLTLTALLGSALSAVVKAGLYEYATNGTTYGEFSEEMFKQLITPKKARRIFG